MNITIFSEICELESCLRQKDTHINANAKINFFVNKLKMKATHYVQFPILFLPKVTLKDSVEKALFAYRIDHLARSSDTIFASEIKKIITKVNLTYKASQQLLLTELVKQATAKNATPWKLEGYDWCSPLLAIIHLPKDPVEILEIPKTGSFHTDRDEICGPGCS